MKYKGPISFILVVVGALMVCFSMSSAFWSVANLVFLAGFTIFAVGWAELNKLLDREERSEAQR